MGFVQTTRNWARRIKRDAVTLWFAKSHPGTPWTARLLGIVVVAYALSPIDLIPDFIPVLGYLDDVILLPALIWLAVRLLPPDVLEECRSKAQRWIDERRDRPRSRGGAVAVIVLWAVVALLFAWWIRDAWGARRPVG